MPAMLPRRAVLTSPLALAACASLPAQGNVEARRLHALFDAYWDDTARMFPEWATFRGDERYGDRFEDASPEGRAANEAYYRALAQRLEGFDRGRLDARDQLSLDLLLREAREELAFQAHRGFRSMSLDALGLGFQRALLQLIDVTPLDTPAQCEQLLARLARYGTRVDQEIARLREGLALGWVSARPVLERALAQLDAQLGAAPADGPYGEPLRRAGTALTPAQRERLLRAIEADVLPAVRRLRGFVAEVYLPKAPADGALLRYPGGDAVYAALVRRRTTTALEPGRIHADGLERCVALRRDMLAAMREAGLHGSFEANVARLTGDPKYFHDSPEALLAGYREIGKRIDPMLPRLFAKLPRAPYGVRAMPADASPDAADFYVQPDLEGTRPGWFNANTQAWRRRPRWAMETLVAHEAVPGHHLQIALSLEQTDLPEFRRDLDLTAYIEGWALYAETLGTELGLYQDPTSRFGHLQGQAFRAARLVVDTGIHALGWSRRQAIDYMVAQTGHDAVFAAGEVDRYTSNPGQALAYMIGQSKLIELREHARAALGARFDLRQFHSALLEPGALPLDLLEQQVQRWTAAQQPPPSS